MQVNKKDVEYYINFQNQKFYEQHNKPVKIIKKPANWSIVWLLCLLINGAFIIFVILKKESFTVHFFSVVEIICLIMFLIAFLTGEKNEKNR